MLTHGFEQIKKEHISEIKADVAIYRHEKLGCELLHIPCEDNNKVFAAQFVTIPQNDCGTAHILEHAVLAGSEKYPLREPFVNLMKGSLHTFLNAMTFPDRTLYPFASQNNADFMNILDVYLDAVFFPIIYKDPLILKQEGWHFDLDEEGNVSFNGVVYNEMQGVLSAPMNIISLKSNKMLFDNPYAYESGGNPLSVVELENEEFLEFHKRFYHPSNAKFFLYGDMPLEEVLKKLDEDFLAKFEKGEKAEPIGFATKKTEAQYKSIPYQSHDGTGFVGVRYISGDSSEKVKHMALSVIMESLFCLDSSPLRKELITSGFCRDIRADADAYMREGTLNIIFDGTVEEDPQKAEETWFKALENALKQDLKPIFKAALNKTAFELREAETGGMPKGLFYGVEALLTWPNGDDPYTRLRFEDALKAVGEMIEAGEMEKLAHEALIDNKFRATLLLKADPEAAARKEAEEAAAAKAAWEALGEEGQKAQREINAKLQKKQTTPDTPELLALLPRLSLDDIEKENSFKNVTEEEISLFFHSEDKGDAAKAGDEAKGDEAAACEDADEKAKVKFLHYDTFTSDISYLHFYFDLGDEIGESVDLSKINEDRLFELSVLTDLLAAVSTEKRDYGELTNEILANVGGIESALDVFKDRIFFRVSTKFLPSQREAAYSLLEEILRQSRFDDLSRVKELLNTMQVQMKTSLIQEGHKHSRCRAASFFSDYHKCMDAIGGVSYFEKLSKLLEEFDEKGLVFCAHLKAVLTEITSTDRLSIALVGDEKAKAAVIEDMPKLSKSLCGGPISLSLNGKEALQASGQDASRDAAGASGASDEAAVGRSASIKENRAEGLIIPSKVQYVSAGGRFAAEGEPFDGRLHVLNSMLSVDYLWNVVRVQSGAYGAFASIDRHGTMIFSSYRDPNCASTLEAYKGIPEYLRALEISRAELEGYIIGAISRFDHPLSPSYEGQRAVNRYFSGLTLEQLAKEREAILSLTLEELKALADLCEKALKHINVCALGGEETLMRDKEMFEEVKRLI